MCTVAFRDTINSSTDAVPSVLKSPNVTRMIKTKELKESNIGDPTTCLFKSLIFISVYYLPDCVCVKCKARAVEFVLYGPDLSMAQHW